TLQVPALLRRAIESMMSLGLRCWDSVDTVLKPFHSGGSPGGNLKKRPERVTMAGKQKGGPIGPPFH
ncbi:MAG: hypothetical protein ABJC63_13615, partial [Gemmatimonadales bacterium]